MYATIAALQARSHGTLTLPRPKRPCCTSVRPVMRTDLGMLVKYGQVAYSTVSGQDQLPGHVQVATLLSPSDGSGIRPRRTVFSVRVAVLTGQGIKPIDLKREKSSAQNVEQKTLKATGTLLTTRMEERLENIGALLVL